MHELSEVRITDSNKREVKRTFNVTKKTLARANKVYPKDGCLSLDAFVGRAIDHYKKKIEPIHFAPVDPVELDLAKKIVKHIYLKEGLKLSKDHDTEFDKFALKIKNQEPLFEHLDNLDKVKNELKVKLNVNLIKEKADYYSGVVKKFGKTDYDLKHGLLDYILNEYIDVTLAYSKSKEERMNNIEVKLKHL